MQALTLRLTPAPDQPGWLYELREGDPAAPGAVLAAVAQPPFSPDQQALLDDLRRLLLTQSGRIRDLDRLATQLGALLMPGAIGTTWTDRMAAAQQDQAEWARRRARILRSPNPTPDQLASIQEQPGYRLFLVVDDPALLAVPWEVARIGGPLFLQDDAPVARFVVVPARRRVSDPELQVRVLVVVAADNPEAIGADEEVRAIKRALRPMDRVYDVDVLRHPSRERLVERLGLFMPHILHFIGHGTGTDLQIYDAEVRKANVTWGPDDIRLDLGTRSWIPDVVYLNACRSQGVATWEEASAADISRQRTIVDALFGRGVLGVVAMQADVRGSAAALCAGEFYGALLEGVPIDVACARGRARIARDVAGGKDGREPYLPVLSLAAPPDQILRHEAVLDIDAPPFVHERLETFVDRYEERRRLVRAVDDQHNVIVVQGAAEIGKSTLLCWTMDLFHRRRHTVRYVELGGCADWLEVLRALRDGNARRQGVQDPLGSLLDPSFNWRLSHLAKGRIDPTGQAAADEPDTAGPLSALKNSPAVAPEFERRVCQAFHDALRPPGNEPLVLVFDQLEAGDRGLSADQFALLREHWINPLIARGNGRVRLLLAIRSDRRRDYGLDPLPVDYGHVPMEYFAATDSLELLEELFRIRLKKEADKVQPYAEAMLAQMTRELAEYAQEALTGAELREYTDALWRNCWIKVRAKRP